MKKILFIILMFILLGVSCQNQNIIIEQQQKRIGELENKIEKLTETTNITKDNVEKENIDIKEAIVEKFEKKEILNVNNQDDIYYDKLNADLKKTCNMNLQKEAGTKWNDEDIKTLYILLENCKIGLDVKEYTEKTRETPFQTISRMVDECKEKLGEGATFNINTSKCDCLKDFYFNENNTYCLRNK